MRNSPGLAAVRKRWYCRCVKPSLTRSRRKIQGMSRADMNHSPSATTAKARAARLPTSATSTIPAVTQCPASGGIDCAQRPSIARGHKTSSGCHSHP